jgi:hypothetical protein
MDIKQLAKKPTLTKLEISDADIVETYGEAVTFYMIDQFDINTYFSFYRLQQGDDSDLLNELLRKLILDSEGKPVLEKDEVFPVTLTLAILMRINEFLGKSSAKDTSTIKTGKSQK